MHAIGIAMKRDKSMAIDEIIGLRKALLIDDNKTYRNIIRCFFKNKVYVISKARNEHEAHKLDTYNAYMKANNTFKLLGIKEVIENG